MVEVPLAFEVRCSTSITMYRLLISRAIRSQWHSACYFHRMAFRAQAWFAFWFEVMFWVVSSVFGISIVPGHIIRSVRILRFNRTCVVVAVYRIQTLRLIPNLEIKRVKT